MKELILQLITVGFIPLVKVWFDRGNKQIAEQLNRLKGDIKDTQVKVDEVTQIGKQNRKSNKSLISYRLHKDFGEAIERGFTTVEDYEELSGLYASYRDIGGNGKISALYDKFQKLPIR